MGQVTASPFRPPRFAPFPKGRRAKREAGPFSRLNRNNTKRAKREAGKPVPIGFHWCKPMNDLLGDALPVERRNDRPEAAALVEAQGP